MKRFALILTTLMLVSAMFTSCLKDDTVIADVSDVNVDNVDASNSDDGIEDEFNLFDMTRDEQIELLKSYICVLEEDIYYQVHKAGSYVGLYEYGSSHGSEIKDLAVGSVTGFSNDIINGESVYTIEVGDWKCTTYESGDYIVSGELLNTNGENVGDKPWKIYDALRFCKVEDERFKSVDDIKAYYDNYLSRDLNVYDQTIDSVDSSFIEFEGELYCMRGESGYTSPGDCFDFDNMEIVVTDNHSCIVKVKYRWFDEGYCEHTYRFDFRYGKFLLAESEVGEWVYSY